MTPSDVFGFLSNVKWPTWLFASAVMPAGVGAYTIMGNAMVHQAQAAAQSGDTSTFRKVLADGAWLYPLHLDNYVLLSAAGQFLLKEQYQTALDVAEMILARAELPDARWVAAEAVYATYNWPRVIELATPLVDDARYCKRAQSMIALARFVIAKTREQEHPGALHLDRAQIEREFMNALPSDKPGFCEMLARNREHEVLYNLACLYSRLGETGKAIAYFGKACECVMGQEAPIRKDFVRWCRGDKEENGDLHSVWPHIAGPFGRVLDTVTATSPDEPIRVGILTGHDTGLLRPSDSFQLHGQSKVKGSEVQSVTSGIEITRAGVG